MSRNQFEKIKAEIIYIDAPPPSFEDYFHEVRQVIEKWNKNMTYFLPRRISCLYDSMSFCTNNYYFPGFIFVPMKP